MEVAEYECKANIQDLYSNSEAVELKQQSKNLDIEHLDINQPKETEIGVRTQAAAEEGLRNQRT